MYFAAHVDFVGRAGNSSGNSTGMWNDDEIDQHSKDFCALCGERLVEGNEVEIGGYLFCPDCGSEEADAVRARELQDTGGVPVPVEPEMNSTIRAEMADTERRVGNLITLLDLVVGGRKAS